MKNIKRLLIMFFLALVLIFVFFFVGQTPQKEDAVFGITFSEKYAQNLDLDWKETYLALLDDLNVKKLRLVAYWDLLEPEKDNYNFENIDWQIKQAEERGAEIVLTIGMKVPRWPECHIPYWAEKMDKEQQQDEIIKMIEKTVLRYKDSPALKYWQIENEPFLNFGECPWKDKEFFIKEVEKARSLDPDKPILVTESGELSFWFSGARIGDLVGTTMYRQTWWHRAGGFYFKYPLPPIHYHRKAKLIEWIFNKEVIVAELQAEPWGPAPVYIIDLEEQEKTMNLEQFKDNIEYAKNTGLREFYFWGAEWWYWMKEKHDRPEIWQEAKTLFN